MAPPRIGSARRRTYGGNDAARLRTSACILWHPRDTAPQVVVHTVAPRRIGSAPPQFITGTSSACRSSSTTRQRRASERSMQVDGTLPALGCAVQAGRRCTGDGRRGAHGVSASRRMRSGHRSAWLGGTLPDAARPKGCARRPSASRLWARPAPPPRGPRSSCERRQPAK